MLYLCYRAVKTYGNEEDRIKDQNWCIDPELIPQMFWVVNATNQNEALLLANKKNHENELIYGGLGEHHIWVIEEPLWDEKMKSHFEAWQKTNVEPKDLQEYQADIQSELIEALNQPSELVMIPKPKFPEHSPRRKELALLISGLLANPKIIEDTNPSGQRRVMIWELAMDMQERLDRLLN